MKILKQKTYHCEVSFGDKDGSQTLLIQEVFLRETPSGKRTLSKKTSALDFKNSEQMAKYILKQGWGEMKEAHWQDKKYVPTGFRKYKIHAYE